MFLAAAALLPALLAGAPSFPTNCTLEEGVAEILAAVQRRETARRLALPKAEEGLWRRHPWQEACAPLAAAWLVDQEESRRIAAAAWSWVNRAQTFETPIYIPVVTEFFNLRSVRGSSLRTLPLTPELRDAFVARAGAEPQPLVLRVLVEQLMELGDLERARAAVRAGLELVPRDADLLGYSFALWNRRGAPALTKPERDLVWSLRSGAHASLAMAVLGQPLVPGRSLRP